MDNSNRMARSSSNRYWQPRYRPYENNNRNRRNFRKSQETYYEQKEDWKKPEQLDGKLCLIGMPDLVGEMICQNLDPASLMILRYVCKTTKSWVEDAPNVLKKLQQEINTSKELQRVVSSSVPWNHFSIKCYHLCLQTHMDKLETTFGPTLRILRITSTSGDSKKISLLKACPQLEILELRDISFEQVTKEEWIAVKKNSSKLKSLKINMIHSDTTTPRFEAFLDWIQVMNNLKFLKIPSFNSNIKVSNEKFDTDKVSLSSLNQFVFGLIKYLELRNKCDRHSNLKYLDVEQITGLDRTLFQTLATMCVKCDVKLLNVPHYFYISKNSTDPPINPDNWKAIQSLSGFDKVLDFDAMTSLTEITLCCFFNSELRNTKLASNYELELPCLKILMVSIYGEDQPFTQSMLDVFLHRSKRPSVIKLNIAWNENNFVNFVKSKSVADNFSNVKSLDISDYKGNDEDFDSIFKGMTLMEELKIKDCKNLTDRAFIGDSPVCPSSFIKLKELKTIWIRTFEKGITDWSLKYAFSKLPLRKFSLKCIGNSTITYEGLSSLNTLPFKNTIQYLDIPKFENLSTRELRTFMKRFSNLIKCN